MVGLKTLRIFVSSPGDVSEERALAERVLRNVAEEYRESVCLDIVLWEHEPLFAHTGFMQQMPRPSQCDLVVCILWSRLGTRLPEGFTLGPGRTGPTGTEFEIHDALEEYRRAGKPSLLIYRKTAAPQLNLASGDARERLQQYELLDEFCRRAFYDQQGTVIVAHHSYTESHEFEKKLIDHVGKWLERQAGEAATRARWTSGSPYRGLQAFQAVHREIFFGRSQALSELIGRLRDTETRAASGESVTRFLLVQGMSGNGKSSLIRAGLLPLLEGRALEGIGLWRQAILKPSDRSEQRPDAGVTGALAAAFCQVIPAVGQSYPDTGVLAERLRNAPAESAARLDGYLAQEAIREGLRPDQIRLVVFIDQLEELFEQSQEQAERAAFIVILHALARAGRIWVIATVRSDFAARLEDHPELLTLTRQGNLHILGPPTSDELADMIREPARAAGLQWEARDGVSLDQAILREATASPESLPLLEYALDQLYERRSGRRLSYAAYEELGGLKGGIARSAEAVLTAQPDIASSFPKLMRALVSVDESGTATRRYAPLTEFAPGTPERALLEALIARRLCVADQRGEEAVASFAHEALIQSWPRVAEWLLVEAALLQTRELALRDTRLWQQHGESEAWLATADKLIAFKALESAHVALPEQGRRFIERSRRRVRRVTRIKQLAVCVIALLAIVASGAGSIASRKQHEAQYQVAETLKAQSRLLTDAAAQRLKGSDVAGAQSIILEVLTSPAFAQGHTPAAIGVFQEIRAADGQLAILSGHGAVVRPAAYSPDGTRIVTGSADNTARIWDARTGVQLAVLSGHGDSVESAAYSPDGSRIVTGSDDNTARIWDARTGVQLAVLGHGSLVLSAAYSPDGTRIVTGSLDKTARIWDARTGAQLAVLSGHGDAVESAAYSPDGSRIVTGSDDKTARIWDARTGVQLAVLSGHGDVFISAAYSPDGTRIVTGSFDKTARIWDARTGVQLAVLSGHGAVVFSAAYSPDSTRIVTASRDKTARIWDARTGVQLAVLSGHGAVVRSAAYSPDGTRVVTGSDDKTARIWDARTGAQLAVLSGHGNFVDSAAYSPDGTRIVTGSLDKTARIWDVRTGVPLAVLSGHGSLVLSAAYSPDGTRIVTGSLDKTARIWDPRTGAQLAVLSGHGNPVYSAAYSPDGTRIVTGSFDKTARIWDARTGVQLAVLSGHGDSVYSAAYSPDGTRVVTASRDKTARIWDARTGAQLAVLSGHGAVVRSAACSPDGTRIVTGSDDKTARIWDARTGVQLAVLSGHGDAVASAAYSPDGTRIVTASYDKTARIWDARTGVQLAVLSGHGDAAASAAYSPDGTRIVTASYDKTARIWDARVPANIAAQIMWDASAETDPLPDVDRTQLGLPPDSRERTRSKKESACDQAAAAFYDPDRLGPGLAQANIVPDVAASACLRETSMSDLAPRLNYLLGRALVAKHDAQGARRQFELAVSKGYRAARVDLAHLLVDAPSGAFDPSRAALLYQQAWTLGVPIAAFEMGHLYEYGAHGPDAAAHNRFDPDLVKAWSWYQKGAEVGEPNALARFAERDEQAAVVDNAPTKRNALLLAAFRSYAAAAERAKDENWPDDAWRNWRYHRATIARLLAREGLMQQVADAYTQVRDKSSVHPPTLWERIQSMLHL